MTPKDIKTALDFMAKNDTDLAAAIKLVGYPAPRNRPTGFATLVDIIVGQQVSVAAGAAIRAKLAATVPDMTPEKFLGTSTQDLRGAGLSGRKVEYGQGLAEAMRDGALADKHLKSLDDDAAAKEITSIRGLGRWSAEIYLMFALGRPDIWPAEDLAITEALRRLKGLDDRPDRTASEPLVEHWRPHRTIGALFLWHYFAGAPA
ncbi:MAG: DNA-3-methyladenine glycosylase 2 family protein [Alphaproteobacteria bacterium]|nr:MAG: DNA-3-methyladenine glycosylase 2 family protein [Alphaproteobacteria bacterium]